MNDIRWPRAEPSGFALSALCWLGGVGCTLALFFAMAYSENAEPAAPEIAFEDLHGMSIPLDTPPERPAEQVSAPVEDSALLSGIEVSASDSPVKIAVVPTDLELLIPAPEEAAPRAKIDLGRLYTELKPKIETDVEFNRVFQQSEVDRRPRALTRGKPRVPDAVRDDADRLSVRFLMLINAKGEIETLRVLKSSGNQKFDAIVARNLREEWTFSPAIRKGKKVRCLCEQQITVKWVSGSPFEVGG